MLAMAASLLLAQAPAPPVQTAPPPQLVSLNVIAVDSHGDPVTDLKDTDLKVEDEGKPQQIALLRPNAAKPALSSPPQPGEYSGRTAPTVRQTTVILFDLLNEPINTSAVSDQELVAALEHAESPEHIFLEILTRAGDLYPVRDLTLSETVNADGGAPWTRQIHADLDKAMRDVLRRRSGVNLEVVPRINSTYQALANVATRMSAIPGRKTLIWVTQGVPIEMRAASQPIDFSPLLNKLAATMNQARISAYTVQQSMRGAGAGDDQSSLTLQRLAELTGGRSYASDRIAQALKESATDARAGYRLGYYLPAEYWDGKFHKIRVSASRPGVRIQTISGYYAIPDKTTLVDKERAVLEAAARTPFDASAVSISAVVTPSTKNAGAFNYQIHIDAADMPLLQRGERFTAQLVLTFLEFDNEGPLHPSGLVIRPKLMTDPLTVNVDLSQDQAANARINGLRVSVPKDIAIDSSIHTVRLLVYNRTADEYGTLTMPVAGAPLAEPLDQFPPIRPAP